MISVIVPVYNLASVLSRCVDSILEQTFPDFELLLIDDGSTDGSAELCDQFQQRDVRIRAIHKRNGGVSSARNEGINAATGDCIAFIDGDDYVSPDYLEKLMLYDDEDLSIGSVSYFYPDDKQVVVARQETSRIEDVNAQNMLRWYENGSLYSIWTSMFRKSIIDLNGIRFDMNTTRGEDTIFMIEYVEKCRTVRFTKAFVYYYVQYGKGGSSSKSFNIKNIYALEYLDKYIRDWLKKNGLKSTKFDNPEYWTKSEQRGYLYDVIKSQRLTRDEKKAYFKLFYSLDSFQKLPWMFSTESWLVRAIIKMKSPGVLVACSIVYRLYKSVWRDPHDYIKQ